MNVTHESLSVSGRTFGIQVGGTGPDVVVFVHGSGFTGAMWLPFARSLEKSARSVMVDLLGHGSSDAVGKGERIDTALDVDMLEAVIAREGTRVHLVGHSYGAVIAARTALRIPKLLRSLCLVEPVLFGPLRAERPAECAAELDHLFGDGKVLDESLIGTDAWIRRFYDYWTGPGAWSLLTQRQRELQLDVADKTFCEVRDTILDPHPFSAYAALPKPLMLIGGGRSTACAGAILSRLGEVAGAMVHVIPSATHFVPITHGPELLEILLRVWAMPPERITLVPVGEKKEEKKEEKKGEKK